MVTRVAVLSDLHGNVPALRAVMREIDEVEVDAVVCCGDIVSGPLPGEILDLLRSLDLPLHCVRGNADRGAVAAFDRLGRCFCPPPRRLVRTPARSRAAGLPGLPAVHRHAGDVSDWFCSAMRPPRRDDEIIVETTPAAQLAEAAASVDADTIVCGNTHMQFDRRAGDHRWVNVGSGRDALWTTGGVLGAARS